MDGVGELVVLHTVASGAQPIAEAIDQEEFPEVLGTIAGDDTILIVTRSAGARVQLTERLRALAGRALSDGPSPRGEAELRALTGVLFLCKYA